MKDSGENCGYRMNLRQWNISANPHERFRLNKVKDQQVKEKDIRHWIKAAPL